MAFGKRSNTSGQNQAKSLAAFDTQPRVIPTEAWEMPLGDSLRSLGMGPDDVYLSPAPLYHAAPLRFCMSYHQLGSTVVVMEQWDARRMLDRSSRWSA